MARLIVADPRSALENAVSMVERQQLPAEITALLEERVSARGFYGVLGVMGAPATSPAVRRELRLDEGRRYHVFTYGARLSQPTTENAVVHGIAIGDALAADPRRTRVLEIGEVPDPAKSIVETCPISGKSTSVPRDENGVPPITEATPAVEIGTEIHYLCDGGHIRMVEEEVVAAEGATGGPVKPTGNINSTQSTGVRTVLYMRVAFPETNRDPQTETAAYDMMRQVNEFFVENSYGNVYLLTTVTPLLILPRSEAWYNGGGGDEYDVRTDAQAAARQLGYDTSQFDLDVVVYNGGPGSFGGLGYVGGKGAWLKSISAGVACHELGHNFGLWHANSWDTGGRSIIGGGANLEYGNTFDTMGNAGAGDLQFNAYHKSKLNWLDRQTFVHNITTSGTYRIGQLDQARLDPAVRYALRIRKDSDRDYWAEFRQKSLSSNRWTRDGLLLNWSAWADSNGGAQLLDVTPGSPDGRTDAPIVIGRTFSDEEAGVHITPIGKAGTTPEAIDVVVNLGTFPGNQPPILTMVADASNVGTNTNVTFSATATDPDGDALSYAWDFGDKTFSPSNAPIVTKSWSAAGEYVVRCTASDMKGRIAIDSAIVRVGAPGTFRITGLVRQGAQPMGNVHVHNGQTGSSYRGAYTESDGSFTIAGLAAGSVTLIAALDGYSFAPSGFTNPVTVGPSFNTANFAATEETRVTLTAVDADCAEGGANPGRFTLARSGSTASALTVNFYPPSGTATRSSDYGLSPDIVSGSPYSSVVIPAGQASVDLTLTAVDDTAAEGPEIVTLEMLPGTGYRIGGAQAATITIQDSDSLLPVVSIGVIDGDASETGESAVIRVSRRGTTGAPLTVRYSVSGSATSGSDYTALGSQVIIPAGAASADLMILPLNDSLPEGSETVTVTISTNAAYIRTTDSGATTATVNVIDDDIAVLNVAATDPNASESNGDTGTFLITRTGATTAPLTVNYALVGTAQQGVDYLPVPGILTIAAGSSVGTVTITPIDDDLGEPPQTVFLQLRGGAGYAVGTSSSATVTITDDSDLPVVTLGVSDGSVGEPSSTGKFKFTTTGTGAGNIVIHYSVSGTATPGTDYNALSGTVSMGRNSTSEITVTPVNDAVAEDFETVTVTIVPDPLYTTHLDTSATLVITDDDHPVASVSTTNDAFTENSGTGKFWISRSGATTAALTVNYTMGGSAINGIDYTSVSGTATIPAGASGVALNIAPINDTLAEGTETIVLTLQPGAYGIGLASATHYLADNETGSLQVRFGTGSASGSENVGVVNIPVTLNTAGAAPVSVDFIINGGTATGGVDYTLAGGTLVFAPGETAKSIPLIILDDQFIEPPQTVIIKLQNASGAALGTSSYTFTINDNEATPAATIGFAGPSSSGAESLSPAPMIVSLSAAQTSPVTVEFAVTGGTASTPDDYSLAAGTLVFAAGETAKIIPNSIVDDGALEPGETIAVTLSNASGAALSANTLHTYTIIDDDTPAVSITATDAAANEAGEAGTFTLTRTGTISAPLTVNLSVTGTAANGIDYATVPSSVIFPASIATATIDVNPLNDTTGEGPENVTVTVLAGAGYLVAPPASASIEIIDDEPGVSIFATEPAAAEMDMVPGVLTFSRTGATTAPLLVNVNFSGTAASGGDYAAIASPVTIPAGAASVAIAVTPVNDSAAEGPENIIATLVAGPGYFVAAPAIATVTLADDDINNPPEVAIISPAIINPGIPTGVGLILEATASDDGKPANPGVVTTSWSRVSGTGTVTFGNPTQASTTAIFSAPGTYVLRLTANDGEFATTSSVIIAVGGRPNWSSQDIGTVGVPGSFSQAGETFTVRGAGANVSGTTDAFRFVFQPMTGNGELIARVVSMSGGNSSAKAGVMFRNSTAANARMAYMSLYGAANTSDDSSFRARASDGASATTTSTDGQNPPFWVRVVRGGDALSGFVSADGIAWTQVGTTQTVAMGTQIFAGLAVTSNNTSALCTAQFDHVQLSTWPTNTGPDVDAGADQNITFPSPASLAATVSDDGEPEPPLTTVAWEKVSGPGSVIFSDPARSDTTATFSAPGSYVLRLVADDGEIKTFNDLTVSTTTPMVTVEALNAAAELQLAPGELRITRAGSTAASLTVRWVVSGSATPDVDYARLGNVVTLAIGEAAALIHVLPNPDTLSEGAETVSVTLEPDPSYLVGTPSAAEIEIRDLPIDAWRLANFGPAANNASISGDAVDGDFDGVPNLLEYALGGDPAVARIIAPIVGREGNDLTLSYRRPISADDLLYSVEELVGSGWTGAAFTESVISQEGAFRLMKARVPVNGALEKIIRLRVSRQ
jgi:hypothetical protein